MLAFSLQASGGGLFISDGGLANLDGCNVFSNEAYVRPPYAPSLSLLQRPAGTFRVLAFCMQGTGGGLIVYGTATLTNTNVYENVASVRLHFEPSWSSAPAPRWNVTLARFLHACRRAPGSTLLARPR